MRLGVITLLMFWLSARAHAGDGDTLQWHGFVSQGVMVSTGHNYLTRSRHGSFEFTEVALSATVRPTEDLTTSVQLFSRDLGPIGNYDAKLDWFQLDWHPVDQFGLRAGRVRMPFGLYNDVSDYDPGRVSVLLPQSVYPVTSRDFLLAVTGGEAYGMLDLGAVGHLDYRAYGGTLFIDVSAAPVPTTVNVPYVAGGRVLWEPAPRLLEGLRIGGSAMALKLEGKIGPTNYELPALLWVGSLEYQRGATLLAAEYGRWHAKLKSSDPSVLPNVDVVSERYYLLATREVAERWQLGAYYSAYFKDVSARTDPKGFQHDVALTIRRDLNASWLIKLEGHYMNGFGAVDAKLNTNAKEQPKDWVVLMLKTTAFF